LFCYKTLIFLQVIHGSRSRISRTCLSLYPLANFIMDPARLLRPPALTLPVPHASIPWPLPVLPLQLHNEDGDNHGPACSIAGINWPSAGSSNLVLPQSHKLIYDSNQLHATTS
jgi:hypothetical protein